MGDAHQRVVPGGIQREHLPVQGQGARQFAVFLEVQREVVQRRYVGGVRCQRALEQHLRGGVPPEFGLDHRHVGKDFLGPLDREIECRLVLLERLVEPAATAQEAGEVEACDGVLRLAADEPPVGGLRVGMAARLLEARGELEIGGGARAHLYSSARSAAISRSARPSAFEPGESLRDLGTILPPRFLDALRAFPGRVRQLRGLGILAQHRARGCRGDRGAVRGEPEMAGDACELARDIGEERVEIERQHARTVGRDRLPAGQALGQPAERGELAERQRVQRLDRELAPCEQAPHAPGTVTAKVRPRIRAAEQGREIGLRAQVEIDRAGRRRSGEDLGRHAARRCSSP